MLKNDSKILWITRTAIFIALLIVIQLATKSFGQFVTGSSVNLLLMASVLTCGIYSGLTVALISPFFAFLLGIGPAFIQLVPFIALGNMAYVLVGYLLINKNLEKKSLKGYSLSAVGVIAASAVKFLLLWLGIVKAVVPLMTQLKAPQVAMLSSAFSWPQLVTALIGGFIALPAAFLIRKAIIKK
jgi:hypothetical protein